MIVELLLFAFAVILFFLLFKTKKNLPPGPWAIPFIGNLPLLYLDQAKKQYEKYGDVFMNRFGVITFVFIANYKLAKEALSSAEFADRPKWEVFLVFEEEKRKRETGGVMQRNGDRWRHSRRFLLRHLRDLGMGKSKLEGAILTEVENLVEEFKSLTKEPSKLPVSINVAILNIIWQLIAGHRYDFNDAQVHEFMKKITDFQDGSILTALPLAFPFLNYLFPRKLLNYVLGEDKFARTIKEFEEVVQPFIDDHLAKLDPNNPTDLMDDYLIEMVHKTSEEYSHFSNDDLMRTTFDLFFAGSDTSANMVCWVLLYLAKFPHIQKKIQKKLDSVVPSDRLPGLEHRDKLTYLDATINEVQRHCSMVSFGLFRSTSKDVTLNGYTIPENTVIMPVSGLDHKNPEYWENPEEVDPTRFLDAEGKFIAQREGFFPFGIGKRQCIGEPFARMELYLILAALLQKFTFSPPEGRQIDLTPMRFPFANLPNKEQLFSIKLRQ